MPGAGICQRLARPRASCIAASSPRESGHGPIPRCTASVRKSPTSWSTMHSSRSSASRSDYTYHLGALCLDLREIDKGMTWLERACDENHWFMPIVHVQFAGNEEVIGHPRFQELLKRMNLDAESLKRLRSRSGKRERTTGPGQERTTGQELSRPGRARRADRGLPTDRTGAVTVADIPLCVERLRNARMSKPVLPPR